MGKMINHIGKIYGNGNLLVKDQKRENKRTYLLCKCKLCDNSKWMRDDVARNEKVISCGCYNKEVNFIKAKDITNQKFGLLTAIYPTSKVSKHNGSIIWFCECECGGNKEISASDLLDLRVISCGCIAKAWQSDHGKDIGNATKELCIKGTNVRNLTMKKSKRNTSGCKGVCWDKSRNKWFAQIRFQGKNYYLGRYVNIKDAIKVRKVAEKKLFGEFLDWYYNEYKK